MGFPGEDLIKTMWVSLADKGVGSLLTPWHMRRTNRAQLENKRQEILLVAQAEADALDIRAGRKKMAQVGNNLLLVNQETEVVGDRAEPIFDTSSIANNAMRSHAARLVLEEVNVAKSVLQAEDILVDENTPAPEKQMDTDWLAAWREGAARVSSEELQSLWGRVLAGEVKSPGQFSLRTLDFLRCLTKDEAQKIEKVSPYVFSNNMLLKYGTLEKTNHPIAFIQFMEMQELGLLSGVETMGLTHTFNSASEGSFIRAFTCNGWTLIARHTDPKREMQVDIYRVTPLGQQVFGLSSSPPDLDYMRELGRHFVTQGFSMSVGQYTPVPGTNGSIRISNEQSV